MIRVWISVSGEYKDEQGNSFVSPEGLQKVEVAFKGKNNRLEIAPGSKLTKTKIHFQCDNSICRIGANRQNKSFLGVIRIGHECSVEMGDDVTSQGPTHLSAAEGTTLRIGHDCMIADRNQIRTEDAHAIYDVNTGKRTNLSRDIIIGNHVWIAYQATILSGTNIGDGSVVGFGSVVKGNFPNNCIIAGVPARVIRKDIAWERPHLSQCQPWVRTSAEQIVKTAAYWNKTIEIETSLFSIILRKIFKGR